MIHPIFTKDPKSQNFSFYGTSICQAYDCKNKESDISKDWEDLFLEVSDSSTEYSFLASDHIFATAIEKYFYHKKIGPKEMFGTYRAFLKDLYLLRKENNYKMNLTSFEINYENFSDLKSCEEYLQKELGLRELGWKEKSPDKSTRGIFKLLSFCCSCCYFFFYFGNRRICFSYKCINLSNSFLEVFSKIYRNFTLVFCTFCCKCLEFSADRRDRFFLLLLLQ